MTFFNVRRFDAEADDVDDLDDAGNPIFAIAAEIFCSLRRTVSMISTAIFEMSLTFVRNEPTAREGTVFDNPGQTAAWTPESTWP